VTIRSPLADILCRLAGQEIPGGCEHCMATQTVAADSEHPCVWHLYVHHDDSCPTYAAIRARTGEGHE
jgi:hypothetical protein